MKSEPKRTEGGKTFLNGPPPVTAEAAAPVSELKTSPARIIIIINHLISVSGRGAGRTILAKL